MPTTAGGDAILFGTAANLEDEAERPHAPKGAAGQAHLLYKRVAEYFPDSALAGEAAWRSADIRWQLDGPTSARCRARRSRRPTCGRRSMRASFEEGGEEVSGASLRRGRLTI